MRATSEAVLPDSGVSQRRAAKALGVGEATVRRDLNDNRSKSERKSFTKAEKRAAKGINTSDTLLLLPRVVVTHPFRCSIHGPFWGCGVGFVVHGPT
jgi:hypothetical protein